MTIDHDDIEPRVRLNRACKEPGPCPDLEAAYLDLHDEVQRLRADLRHVIDERDATFALMLARAEKAEAERDRVAAEWAETSQRNYQRAKAAEAERDALWAALEEIADGLKGIARDIQIGPDDEGREIYDMVQAMQWDARQALKGQTNE